MHTVRKICYNEPIETIFREIEEPGRCIHQVTEECRAMTASHLADKLAVADLRAAYDENAKLLLAEKEILSWVLVHTVEEYRGMKPEEVFPLIEGTPQISQFFLLAGQENIRKDMLPEVTGDRTESVIPGEGSITFDIKFHAWLLGEETSSKLLIDVEAQKNYYPGYDIVTRGIFYGSRMISGQYGTEFTNAEYDKLKKVYSIWVCTDVPTYAENTVTKYSLSQENLAGCFPKGKSRYDLLSVIVVGLPKNPEQLTDRGLPRLLGVLFSMELSVAEKKRILETEYHISMTKEINRREKIMCNLSEGIWEKGIEQGMQLGVQQGEKKLLEKTKIIIQNMLMRGMTEEDICVLAECDKDLVDEVQREMYKC